MTTARPCLRPISIAVRFDPVAPALRSSPRCPGCGRAPAVVFPDLRAGGPPPDAPRVCLDCCPRVPRGSSPAV
jgi:hypothetical protein